MLMYVAIIRHASNRSLNHDHRSNKHQTTDPPSFACSRAYSYADNSVNGKPTCADDWLLTTVARDNWHFEGYITSDCDGAKQAAGRVLLDLVLTILD